MTIRKVLLLYKKSSYENYFLHNPKRSGIMKKVLTGPALSEFKQTHTAHYKSLETVEVLLKKKGIVYKKVCRGGAFKVNEHDLIITVGGDGTFLEASSQIKNQLILGVNSDPNWSVGRFCCAHAGNIEDILNELLKGKAFIQTFQRMSVKISSLPIALNVLNDILICHQNPGAMSRYVLQFKGIKEDQRSSGVWVATAAGSSGAIYSAGGQLLPQASKFLQYKPRELYMGTGVSYKLKGGLIDDHEQLKITSLMREGIVFIDGSHDSRPFPFGSTIVVSRSKYPLNAVWH